MGARVRKPVILPASLPVCLFVCPWCGHGRPCGCGGASVSQAGWLSVRLSVCVFLIVPFYVWSACLVCVCVSVSVDASVCWWGEGRRGLGKVCVGEM